MAVVLGLCSDMKDLNHLVIQSTISQVENVYMRNKKYKNKIKCQDNNNDKVIKERDIIQERTTIHRMRLNGVFCVDLCGVVHILYML